MNRKKFLCFDFDGTLADSTILEKRSMVQTIHYFGNETITEDNITDYYGPTEPGILKKILGEEEYRAALPYFFSTYSELQKTTLSISNDIVNLLKLLKENHPEVTVLLITGRSQETLEISLEYLGIEQYFVKTYSGSEDGINKGENMKKAMHDFDCEKEDMLYIGDTLEDIQTMEENDFDLFSVGYYHDENYQKELRARNTNTFKTVQELQEAVLKII